MNIKRALDQTEQIFEEPNIGAEYNAAVLAGAIDMIELFQLLGVETNYLVERKNTAISSIKYTKIDLKVNRAFLQYKKWIDQNSQFDEWLTGVALSNRMGLEDINRYLSAENMDEITRYDGMLFENFIEAKTTYLKVVNEFVGNVAVQFNGASYLPPSFFEVAYVMWEKAGGDCKELPRVNNLRLVGKK